MIETINPRSTDVPPPRVCGSLVLVSNYLYLVGGDPTYLFPIVPTNKEVWRFQLDTKIWKRLTCNLCPVSRCHYQRCLVIGPNIFIFHQTSDADVSPRVMNMFLYPLAGSKIHQWLPVTSTNLEPILRAEIYIQSPDDATLWYIFGDDSGAPSFGDSSYELAVYTMKVEIQKLSVTWSKVDTIGRTKTYYKHSATLHERVVYVLYGSSALGNRDKSLKTLDAFNLDTNIWSKIETNAPEGHWPGARYNFSLLKCIDTIYMIGGTSKILEDEPLFLRNSILHVDIWRLSLTTFEWHLHSVGQAPALAFISSCTTQRCLYLFGGVNDYGKLNNTLSRVTFEPPTIKKMAMTAVMREHPHLTHFKREQLLAIGIPGDLVDMFMFDNLSD